MYRNKKILWKIKDIGDTLVISIKNANHNSVSKVGYPMVAITFPVHNNKEDTAEFLKSLKKVTYPNYKLIIVDDGSNDGTEDIIKKNYPDAILLRGDGNLWWSRATNIAIQKAIDIKADYVLMTDHDTIVNKNFISRLVDVAERNPETITTSKCYCFNSKRINHIGWKRVGVLRKFKMIGSNEIDYGQYDNIQGLVGTTISVLVKTDYFTEIGMMNYKKFPHYYADLDFSYRASRKGYQILLVPESIIWHKDSASVKKSVTKKTSFWKTFIFLVSDKRSTKHFPTIKNFYLSYWPFYALPFLFVGYFKGLFIWCLKNRVR